MNHFYWAKGQGTNVTFLIVRSAYKITKEEEITYPTELQRPV